MQMNKRFLNYTWIIVLSLLFNLVFVNPGFGKGKGFAGMEYSPVPSRLSQGLSSIPFSSEITNRLKFVQSAEDGQFLFSQNLQNEKEKGSLWEDEFQKTSGRKSTTKAMLLSLLLPGAGELYAENKSHSRIFLGIEGSIWSTFFAFRTYGSWKKRDYKGYSALHAEVDLEGKNDDFFEDITYYDNRDEYNQFARLYNGDKAVIYPENDFWNWEWDSQDSKGRYRELRNQSKSAYRRALYMVGLAALNRVVSVLDAVRSVKKFNRKLGSEFSSAYQSGLRFSLDANFFSRNPHFSFSLSKNF
jgi:hypothetical protein